MNADETVLLLKANAATAGAISQIAIASLSPFRVVTAMRDGGDNLRLISWDVSSSGEISRNEPGGTATAGAISEKASVAIAPLGPFRVMTAMRDGGDNLRLISWDVSSSGEIVRRGVATAGTIGVVTSTSLTDLHGVVAMSDGQEDLRLIPWKLAEIAANFTFDDFITEEQRAILLERHRFAFSSIATCSALSTDEKVALILTYRSSIDHGISTDPKANASSFIGGSKILVNFNNLLPLGNDEIAQTLVHEMMHCAGFDHPERRDPPDPHPDVPGDNGRYYGTPPLRAELCIAGQQSIIACLPTPDGARSFRLQS